MEDKVRGRLEVSSDDSSGSESLLCDQAVLTDLRRMQELNKERSDITEVIEAFRRLRKVEADGEENRALLDDADPEMRKMAKDEAARLDAERAGAGGADQGPAHAPRPARRQEHHHRGPLRHRGRGGGPLRLELLRLYMRYAELKRWKVEQMSLSSSSSGGIREAIVSISGKDVYSHLRFESGVHRVQRVPVTEAQGRIHTSAATVAVLPEADEVDVRIEDKDRRSTSPPPAGFGRAGRQHHQLRRAPFCTSPAASWSTAWTNARSTRTRRGR